MYQQQYGFTLLDDLHNFYPEILYGDPDQWQNVSQLIRYIQAQTQNRFNLYSRGGRQWVETQNRDRALAELMEPRPQMVPPQPVHPHPTQQVTPNQSNQETVTPQRSVRPLPIPSAPIRISHSSRTVRIPPPGNSPAYLSENEEDEDLEDTTHVAASLINTIQHMMAQDPITATVQSMLDLGAGQRRVTQISAPIPINYIYRNEGVPNVPSQTEISRATRVYNATTADTESEDVCAICQDNYTDGQPIRRVMHCDHKFHKSCIDTWFGRNTHCPVCRHDIQEHT